MARTVALGTITQALIDTQNVSGRVPYFDISIDDVGGAGAVNYGSRLEYFEYHEEAYRDRAIIGLSNRDNALDSLDLDGQEFEMKLGYDTTAQSGSATDTATYPTLWVKSHQIISVEGERIYQIYAEGMWMRLREQKVIAGVTGPQNELYSNVFNRTHTVYGLMKLIIEGALGWTLTASPPDDEIIDIFRPVFEVNSMPFENAAALLYRLIWMTKEYLRPRASKTFQCVYPQTSDAVDETYYSYQAHWFTEYVEKTILLIPNSIVVLCNQDLDTGEWNTVNYKVIIGTATDATQIAKYAGGAEIVEVFRAGSINNQYWADLRAAAILTRLKSEILAGRLVIPHDARVELYDKVRVQDART